MNILRDAFYLLSHGISDILTVYGSSSALRGVQLKIGEKFKPPAKVSILAVSRNVKGGEKKIFPSNTTTVFQHLLLEDFNWFNS